MPRLVTQTVRVASGKTEAPGRRRGEEEIVSDDAHTGDDRGAPRAPAKPTPKKRKEGGRGRTKEQGGQGGAGARTRRTKKEKKTGGGGSGGGTARERKREREARSREAGKSRKREGTNASSVFPGARFLDGRRQDAAAPPMTVVSLDFAPPRFAVGGFLRGATARKNLREKGDESEGGMRAPRPLARPGRFSSLFRNL
ncbi:hypothetical protein DBV15_07113 [Temnothorax longispinosus]|uniref:Uncharacterized protein n=1 Tax=Temnothorax longispinosus TaxID=300112 RepID=A0A4S2KRP9_9HYME|nr:hypothetical protein DBV15_07113 [Temnothorax longispinosus]